MNSLFNGRERRGSSKSAAPFFSKHYTSLSSAQPSVKAVVQNGSQSRGIALQAMFGCLWGVTEIQLGTALQSIGIPFRGAFLAGIAVVLLSMARVFNGARGSALAVGITAGFLKTLFVGSLAFYPVIGILTESIIVEIILWPRFLYTRHFLAAGVLSVGIMLFFPFLTHGILGGWKVVDVYRDVLQKASAIIGLGEQNAFIIVTVLFALHACLGLIAGTIARLSIILLENRLSYNGTIKGDNRESSIQITETSDQ
jgi:hypothetical protein